MKLQRVMTISAVAWSEMIRRKDIYVLLILLAALLVYLMSMDVFGLGGSVGYVKDIGFLMTWLLTWILAVTASSRQLPQEEKSGTIYPLLAKPITRAELICGKWLGVWLAITLAAALFYAATCGVVLLRGGSFSMLPLVQGLILHDILLGMIVALTILLSTRLNADAAGSLGFVVSIAAFAIVPRIPEFLAQEGGVGNALFHVMFYALPHFELFDMRHRIVHNWDGISWQTLGGISVYGAVWIALLLLLAYRAYRKKRFHRGAA